MKNKTLKTIMFYGYMACIILAVAAIIFHLGTAEASECKHHCDETPTTTVIHNDRDDGWKRVLAAGAGGAIIYCRVKAGYAGFTQDRWWTWCGEREQPKPLPNPGPAPHKDVTPEIPTGVRLYQ